MLEKAKKILRNESGMSIIIVLSIGAFFVALSAAVLYAASLQTASANRVLPREDAYRMAYSFTENVLEPDLKAQQADILLGKAPLKSFLMNTFLNPDQGYENGKSYTFTGDDGSDTDETVTITLKKFLQKDAAPISNPPPILTLPFDDTTTADQVVAFNKSAYIDYTIAVTVEVEVGGESYALTKRYSCYARYAYNGEVYKYKGTNFSQIEFPTTTAELEQLKGGVAVGYYIWLPEGGEG